MLKIVLDRLYIKKLEYEIERADIPDDYIKKDAVVTLPSLTHIFNSSKPIN